MSSSFNINDLPLKRLRHLSPLVELKISQNLSSKRTSLWRVFYLYYHSFLNSYGTGLIIDCAPPTTASSSSYARQWRGRATSSSSYSQQWCRWHPSSWSSSCTRQWHGWSASWSAPPRVFIYIYWSRVVHHLLESQYVFSNLKSQYVFPDLKFWLLGSWVVSLYRRS